MNATHRSPLKLVKQSVGWNNAKEQICNQCTSRLSRYLWFTYESGGIFPTFSAFARSRFSAGVAMTNISMQLALLYSELDYLTYNPAYSWARVITHSTELHVSHTTNHSCQCGQAILFSTWQLQFCIYKLDDWFMIMDSLSDCLPPPLFWGPWIRHSVAWKVPPSFDIGH